MIHKLDEVVKHWQQNWVFDMTTHLCLHSLLVYALIELLDVALVVVAGILLVSLYVAPHLPKELVHTASLDACSTRRDNSRINARLYYAHDCVAADTFHYRR